jgi:hypothetical protein
VFEHFLGYFELMDWFVGVSRVLMMYFWVYIASKLGFNFFCQKKCCHDFLPLLLEFRFAGDTLSTLASDVKK